MFSSRENGKHGLVYVCLLQTQTKYYHYVGNAKKSINIFYSFNRVRYDPRYACGDRAEGNTTPEIYV